MHAAVHDGGRVEPLRARRVPMLLAAGCFAGGVALARWHWHTPFEMVCSVAGLTMLTLAALRWAPRVAWVPVLALWVAAGCWCAEMQGPVARQTELVQRADGLSRVVRGTVEQVRALDGQRAETTVEATEPWLADAGAWESEDGAVRLSVDLRVSAIEDVTPDESRMQPLDGGLRVTLGEAGEERLPALRCGDVVEVPLRLREPDVYRDPGAWSYADYLLENGIGALGSAGLGKRPAGLRVVGHSSASWHCRLQAAQAWAAGRIERLVESRGEQRLPGWLRLSDEDGAMLAAMLFGDRQGLTHALRTGFERTGTFHLFVVSGLHVALLAGGLLWGLRRLRVPYAAAVVMSLLAGTGYALLTGWGVPVQRALLMTGIYMLARLMARDNSQLNALGTAALLVLAMSPRALFTASFAMTFLVIFAIAGIGEPLQERGPGRLREVWDEIEAVRWDAWLHPRVTQARVRLRMWGELMASLVAPLGQDSRLARIAERLPAMGLRLVGMTCAALLLAAVTECCMVVPMAVFFHRATVLALPANLLCLPMIGFALGAAVATFLVALVSVKLALVPAVVTAALLHFLRFVVEHVGRVSLADLRVPSPAVLALIAAAGALVAALWALRTSRRWTFALGVVALLLVPTVALWPARPLVERGVLEVTALDVGQGDSLLVVSPEGRTVLVDAGGPVGVGAVATVKKTNDKWDVGEEVVAPYLWSRRLRRLDAVMLTHAHSDHMGGMPAVLRDLRPRELWLGVQPGRAPGLMALRDEAKELGIAVRWFRAGDAFAWGGVRAEVLAPEPGYANSGAAVNDDSLVMRLAYGAASVLLEGDAQSRSEQAMLANGRVEASTLLKVGHHGSKTSTTPEFLAAVHPQDAVVSVGKHNTFGHPRRDVLQRMQEASVKTVRTDRVGVETFWLTADGAVVRRSGDVP